MKSHWDVFFSPPTEVNHLFSKTHQFDFGEHKQEWMEFMTD